MKAIILRAGEGSRLRPFSNTIPKPLIEIFGKSILEHNLENIYNSVDEIIIVVKYKKEEIINKLGDNFNGVKINYFIQGDDKGTAGALRGIDIKNSDILILNGDSIFSKSDLDKIINLKGYGALVKEVEDPSKYGIFSQDNFGFATKIIEKPSEFVGNLANLGVYKFDNSILEISNNISLSQRGEYEITDSINEFIKNNKFNLIPISGDFIDVGYPWDILGANKYFLDHLNESKIDGIVEDGVTIKGNIILAPGAILKSGTYIEGNIYIGENTSIGPNAYLRGSSVIGKNCHIGASVEIKNSSIGNKTNIAHLSYIGDSIIGNNINIGGGFISANLRHDNQNIKVPVKGVLTDTKLRKLGIIIGDNSKLGIKNYSYPGRVLENGSFTPPGEIIK
ncbi:NTP transferase domain-containing protein [Candidatus Gracilibacteria bacterium]|nr:NTP transferase domain-containing protein [Candidatus Gracilibacteria bacterium]